MLSRFKGIGLQEVVQVFESIAPLRLAENWDNIGLLVEPSSPLLVKKLLLTNDLTQPVLEESLDNNCNMILSYHPPIFQAMKQLRPANIKQNLVIQCLENRVAVFSPHTSYDVVNDGVNQWLISAFGELQDLSPVTRLEDIVAVNYKLLAEKDFLRLKQQNNINKELFGDFCYVTRQSTSNLSPIEAISDVGSGRKARLLSPMSLSEAVDRIKGYLNLPYLRVAVGEGTTLDSKISTVACCAGSGSSVLNNCDVDVYLSGEMSHHDVLHATSHNRSVILCEHSNSERGFLMHLQKRLSKLMPQVECIVSRVDADPLIVM